MMLDRRGETTLFAYIILMLFAIISLGLVWVIIENPLDKGVEEIHLDNLIIDAQIKEVKINEKNNSVDFYIERKTGKEEIFGLKFIFYNKTTSEIIERKNLSLNELESIKFNFTLEINTSTLTRLVIIPIFKKEEKESFGKQIINYNFASKTSTTAQNIIKDPEIPPEECNHKTCSDLNYECGSVDDECEITLDCDNPGCGNNSNCSSGICICDSGWEDCNNDNSCECNLSSNSCFGGVCFAKNVINVVDSLGNPSCEQVDVQAAIDLAVNGDIVQVSAGKCIWNTTVRILNGKAITLRGAGIDSTIINRSTPGGDLVFAGPSAFRITGFTFNEGYMVIDGDGWRVDNCKIYSNSFSEGIFVRGVRSSGAHPTGLVDNCFFHNTRVLIIGTAAMLHEDDRQHILWTKSLDLGTFNNIVYVEDCDFEANVFGNLIDTNYGGAYVFRFNHVLEGTYLEAHSVQGDNRGTRRWEIYGNIIDNQRISIYYPFRIRAGTGVIFNNIIKGTWTNYGIALDNVRSYDARGSAGKCNSSSLWDGNEDETGYPCRDQIGRGPDTSQWNHNPPGIYTQPLIPAYAWENHRESNNALIPFNVINSGQDHIKAERDFYNQPIIFDGTLGVGSGLLVNRPTTCTPGVAYWATNVGNWNKKEFGEQGVLYKCVSQNQWELYYTPYTYPHPLTLI